MRIPFFIRLFYPGIADYKPYYTKLCIAANDPDADSAPQPGAYYSYPITTFKTLYIQHALPNDGFDPKATKQLLAEARRYWKSHELDDAQQSAHRRFIFGLLSDRSVRVADLVVRWNIVRHFYPYYEEELEEVWDKQLERFLEEAIEIDAISTPDGLYAWYRSICRFMNPVHDGHLIIHTDMSLSQAKRAYLPEYHAPVSVRVFGDTVLIRNPLATHDSSWRILTSVDDVAASDLLQRYIPETNAATDAHRTELAANRIFASTIYGTPFLCVSRDAEGTTRCDTLRAQWSELPATRKERSPLSKMGDGILYVDTSADEVTEKTFLKALTPDVKGICFDLKGYPTHRFEKILAHLLHEDIEAPATRVPIVRFPFREHLAWRIGTEIMKARAPRILLPAVFLCDASTVSWGETILMMVRRYRLGIIIGQITAGTTGDMTRFDLPLFPFSMTGMQMTNMDGTKHHSVGIIPDQSVPVYAEEYMQGYDRTLQTAMKTLRNE